MAGFQEIIRKFGYMDSAMVTTIESNKAGTDAVRKMRLEKFRKGVPFMINSRDLPSEQCYLEYPSGIIKLVRLAKDSKQFITVRELSISESSFIRHKFHLA